MWGPARLGLGGGGGLFENLEAGWAYDVCGDCGGAIMLSSVDRARRGTSHRRNTVPGHLATAWYPSPPRATRENAPLRRLPRGTGRRETDQRSTGTSLDWGAAFSNPTGDPCILRGRAGGTCLWLQGAGTSFLDSAGPGAWSRLPACVVYADPAAENAPPTAHPASMLCHGRRAPGRYYVKTLGLGRQSSRPWEGTRTAHCRLYTGETRRARYTGICPRWRDGLGISHVPST